MIKVLFFARIREQLNCPSIDLTDCKSLLTLADLQSRIVAENDARWLEVLAAPNVVRAINQEVAELTDPVSDGDEVAFFPPVTGG